MGIPDPEGKKYHRDDWKSNDGVRKDVTQHWVTVWVHITKALLKNIILAMDPLVAWKQIEHCEHTVNFLGGNALSRGETMVSCHLQWAEARWEGALGNRGS